MHQLYFLYMLNYAAITRSPKERDQLHLAWNKIESNSYYLSRTFIHPMPVLMN